MTKLFSSNQIAWSTLLGGPLAAVYFLKKNYDAMGRKKDASKTLMIGIAATIILALLAPFIPENFPSFIIPVSYTSAVYFLTKYEKMHKSDIKNSEEFDFQSNWSVLGIAILSFILFIVMLVGSILFLETTGLLTF